MKDGTRVPATVKVKILMRTVDVARCDWAASAAGGGVTRMPSMWRLYSYPELEAQLRAMREAERQLWYQASARYRWGEERWTWVPVTRKNKRPSYHLPGRSELLGVGEHAGSRALVLLYRWAEVVIDEVAEEGVASLTARMYSGNPGAIAVPEAAFTSAAGQAMMADGTGHSALSHAGT